MRGLKEDTLEVEWCKDDFASASAVKKAYRKAVQLKEALRVLKQFDECTASGEILYRYEDKQYEQAWRSRTVGNCYKHKGFLSSTTLSDAPAAIEGNSCSVKIALLQARGIRLIGPLTSHAGESEVLLDCGQILTVTVAEHAANAYVCQIA